MYHGGIAPTIMPKNMHKPKRNADSTLETLLSLNDKPSVASFFQHVFEASPNPYLVLLPDTPKFTIAAVNNSYLAATNTQRSDLLGRGLFEVFPDNPKDASATGVSDLHISLERVIQDCVQDVMGVQKYDIPVQGANHFEVKYWSPVNSPVFDQTGELAYIIHRVEDITEFILLRERTSQENARIERTLVHVEQMEAEVLKSSRELKEANRQIKAAKEESERREQELAQLNERLKELDRLKTSFFSNISHEFRTPLTLMLGPMEDTLQDPQITPKNREQLEIAYRNTLRLLRLVNNLLDFARIEAGRVQAHYQPTDLRTITQELVSMFSSATSKAGLKLAIDCPPLPEPVYVDHDMWEKIVLNLVSNAFKHTFEGEIEVRLCWKRDHIELIVRDTGIGISTEQLPHLFERFYRVPNAPSRSYEGSGIGLALVNELVRLHGGQIEVHSTLGQGTTFTVSLPAGYAHLPESQVALQENPTRPTRGAQPMVDEALHWLPQNTKRTSRNMDENVRWYKPNGQPVQVLLADDNADMRNYVCRLLEPYCDIETASNGEEALKAAIQKPPDLVLSDIMMPTLDGFGLLRALRNHEALKTIPIILLSARAGEEARIEGLQAGADDYLVKPFNARELLARVKANLNLELHRARQEAEASKQESEERYKSLFNQAAAGIAQTDLAGKFLLVNQRFCEMVGRSQDELLGIRMQDITPAEDLKENVPAFEQTVMNGIPFAIEKRYMRPDGTHIWVRNHVSLVREKEGVVPQAVLAISQDITDRKEAEMALEAAQARLKKYTAKLERSNKELEHFAMIASHDLQEPLRKVILFSEHLRTILENQLTDEAQDDIERLQRATRRMQNLIDDLLDLSRVTRKGKSFQKTELASIMKEVTAELHFALKESGGRIELGPMMTIDADPGQMHQLLECLIDNALKFHREGCPPVIKVSAQPLDSQYCQLTVEDNGIGIKSEYQERIFDTFTRLHGKNTYPGTGIGLAIVKKIAERHNGTVKVESLPDQGSNFIVTLPIYQYQLED